MLLSVDLTMDFVVVVVFVFVFVVVGGGLGCFIVVVFVSSPEQMMMTQFNKLFSTKLL